MNSAENQIAAARRVWRTAHYESREQVYRLTLCRSLGPPPNARARQWWLRRTAGR